MVMYIDTPANRDLFDQDVNLLEHALTQTINLISFFEQAKLATNRPDARDVLDCLKSKLDEAIDDSQLANVVDEINREPLLYGPMS